MANSVSVITTFYRAENYLAEAVESVLAQRGFDEWEFILVDDGSPDDSRYIADSYARDFPDKIRVVSHPNNANLGISASRNLGFSLARGEFIAFLDADDVWLPDKLCEQINLFRRHKKAAMVYGAAERWFDWDKSNREKTPKNFVVAPDLPGIGANVLLEPPALLTAFLRDESLTPCVCSALVRGAAFAAVNGFSDSFRGLYDDQIFYAKLALRFPVYVSGKCWARYRQHPASCCATAWRDGSHQTVRMQFLQWLRRYLDDCGADSLRETLNHEIMKIEEK